MTKKLAYLTLILILVSAACNAPFAADPPGDPTLTPEAVSALIVSADPNSTATATPFQPIGPTLTPTITLTPTPTPTATPTETPVPTASPTFNIPEESLHGIVNILLLGSDSRPNEGGFRTDVIMFISIDKSKEQISVISFPRDLYVTIPGWTTQRINTAFAHGGFSLMAETFQYNFGVRPQYYILTNFQGFKGIIDSLGGINVNVSAPLSDACDLHQAVKGRCTINPGVVTMDGDTALWYVRSRHSTSDFDRMRRAQEVIYGLFNRFMHIDAVRHLPEFYEAYKNSVQTNMSVMDLLPILPTASKVASDPSRVHRYTVTPAMVSDYIAPGGAMVLLPNLYAINAMINEAINGQ